MLHSSSMPRSARWTTLLEMIAADGVVEIDDAAMRLDVSPATVRRDLDQLAAQQLARTHPRRRGPAQRLLRSAAAVQAVAPPRGEAGDRRGGGRAGGSGRRGRAERWHHDDRGRPGVGVTRRPRHRPARGQPARDRRDERPQHRPRAGRATAGETRADGRRGALAVLRAGRSARHAGARAAHPRPRHPGRRRSERRRRGVHEQRERGRRQRADDPARPSMS